MYLTTHTCVVYSWCRISPFFKVIRWLLIGVVAPFLSDLAIDRKKLQSCELWRTFWIPIQSTRPEANDYTIMKFWHNLSFLRYCITLLLMKRESLIGKLQNFRQDFFLIFMLTLRTNTWNSENKSQSWIHSLQVL